MVPGTEAPRNHRHSQKHIQHLATYKKLGDNNYTISDVVGWIHLSFPAPQVVENGLNKNKAIVKTLRRHLYLVI